MIENLTHWTARQRPTLTPLEGRYTRLEPFDAARHSDQLFAASMGAEAEALHRYLFEEPRERATFQAWFDSKLTSSDPLYFVVIDRATGRVEGRQTLMRIDPAHGVIETGSILWGPGMARSRLSSEALYLFARHVFDDLGYRRFEWKCNDLNEPSKRAALRFGFSFEGIFRQHMVVKGANRDTAWYAMIDRDWPRIRAGFEAWLDPANFDAAGQQKTRLEACRDAAASLDQPAFRRAGPADIAALTALQRASYAKNRAILGVEPLPLLADYAEIVATKECWLAEQAGELAGALIVEEAEGGLLIWSVATAPHAQGRGVGDRLLAFAETLARARNAAFITLYTGQKLAGNIAWYLRRGFLVTHTEQLPDRVAVHMRKRLPA